jgi:hypothetical protein
VQYPMLLFLDDKTITSNGRVNSNDTVSPFISEPTFHFQPCCAYGRGCNRGPLREYPGRDVILQGDVLWRCQLRLLLVCPVSQLWVYQLRHLHANPHSDSYVHSPLPYAKAPCDSSCFTLAFLSVSVGPVHIPGPLYVTFLLWFS